MKRPYIIINYGLMRKHPAKKGAVQRQNFQGLKVSGLWWGGGATDTHTRVMEAIRNKHQLEQRKDGWCVTGYCLIEEVK